MKTRPMPLDLSNKLVVAVSSRALFDLRSEHEIFQNKGLDAYKATQIESEEETLRRGTGFPLIEALLRLNDPDATNRHVEVVLMSKNSPAISLRIFRSIREHGLDIKFATLSGGRPIAGYLNAYSVDLFLSADHHDVAEATKSGIAAGTIYPYSAELDYGNEIRLALDGDAVIFSNESECFYRSHGLNEFLEHERRNAKRPLSPGPFAQFLQTLMLLRQACRNRRPAIRVALVTSRDLAAHERVLRTLISWDVDIEEAHFTGGIDKTRILRVFQPHIYFDDCDAHCRRAANCVPTAQVHSDTASSIGIAASDVEGVQFPPVVEYRNATLDHRIHRRRTPSNATNSVRAIRECLSQPPIRRLIEEAARLQHLVRSCNLPLMQRGESQMTMLSSLGPSIVHLRRAARSVVELSESVCWPMLSDRLRGELRAHNAMSFERDVGSLQCELGEIDDAVATARRVRDQLSGTVSN